MGVSINYRFIEHNNIFRVFASQLRCIKLQLKIYGRQPQCTVLTQIYINLISLFVSKNI